MIRSVSPDARAEDAGGIMGLRTISAWLEAATERELLLRTATWNCLSRVDSAGREEVMI
jgi:hypothetical protein